MGLYLPTLGTASLKLVAGALQVAHASEQRCGQRLHRFATERCDRTGSKLVTRACYEYQLQHSLPSQLLPDRVICHVEF